MKLLYILISFVFISVSIFAQYVPPDIGVEPADAVTAISSTIGTAIGAALGLAVTIYAVIVGWQKIKLLSKG